MATTLLPRGLCLGLKRQPENRDPRRVWYLLPAPVEPEHPANSLAAPFTVQPILDDFNEPTSASVASIEYTVATVNGAASEFWQDVLVRQALVIDTIPPRITVSGCRLSPGQSRPREQSCCHRSTGECAVRHARCTAESGQVTSQELEKIQPAWGGKL